MGIYGDARPIIYALHEFCWHLLLERIGVSPRDSRSVAAWLFHVLAALPYSRAGGLITRDGYSGGSVDSAEIRHADPSVHIFSGLIDDTVLPDEIKAPKSLFKSRQQPAVGDPFSRLPLEIMHDVFDFLSSVDLCAARLASRSFADCAAPAALPQRFWSGRFAPDKEMGFIDLETAKPRLPSIANDYYQYYRKCQQALRAEVIPEGLINRRRIWGCLDHFAVTLRALLSVRGDGTGNVFPQPPRLPNVHSLGQVVSCPELSSATAGPGSLVFGARIRHKEILVIDRNPPIYCPILLEFSTIDFDGRRYISGLQLSAGTDSYHCVGLMVPSATAPVSLEPETSIYEIDVYMSIAGIHGIIIHAKTPDGRETAHAVGDTEPAKDSDTAVTRLEARGNILGFSLGFDVRGPPFFPPTFPS